MRTCVSAVIKDVFSSADKGGFGFNVFDDGGSGFDELLESLLVSIAPRRKRNMPYFQKTVFISITVMDSHGSLNNFVNLILQ